jgi:hypothetical protein
MPEYAKDAIIGVLGTSVTLAGLLLVFSGFLFAQAASFPPATTDDRIINKFRNAGRFGLFPFLLCLLAAILSLIWFIHPAGCVYYVDIILFLITVVGSAVYGTVVLWFYL